MKRLLVLVFCIAVITFACTQNQNTGVDRTSSDNQDASSPMASPEFTTKSETGATLFADNCAVCHRDDGTGGKTSFEGRQLDVDDLTSKKIKAFSDHKITNYIRNGIEDEGMPAFKDQLSEEQVRTIVRYIRSDIQKIEK
ncbi:MAG: cytochrome c [Acidobacteria bacterium]|nr:cytochrome c [Acidobacteriota bacterium]MCA1607858.1 cytochrome c [Acidobacteriota bacterium]